MASEGLETDRKDPGVVMPDPDHVWTLTFRPLPYPADTPAADRVPVPNRVRTLLKVALWRLGLRCVRVQPGMPETEERGEQA